MDEITEAGRTGGTEAGRTVIGGRHGSPSVTVALPFSNIVTVDADLRSAVAELATLVAQLATHVSVDDRDAVELVRQAAQELADRLDQAGR